MNKNVIYQITRTQYKILEVETEEQEKAIRELNRDFEREDKRRKTARAKCVSIDYLNESTGYEPIDDSQNAESNYLEKEEKELIKTRLHNAINKLTKRQKEMVIMIYFEEKSQDEVAEYFSITKSAVSHAMKRIYARLKNYLEKN